MSNDTLRSAVVSCCVAGGVAAAAYWFLRRSAKPGDKAGSAVDDKDRSTTSSAGGGPVAYETKRAVDEYLQFHYAAPEEILPYNCGPKDSLNFAEACALLCEKHCKVLQDFTGEYGESVAIDIGCSVGGMSFELARVFDNVIGIDYSHHFIMAAQTMKADGRMQYETVIEGSIMERRVARVAEDVDRARVHFRVGDACALPPELPLADCLLAANLLCRLPDPMLFLKQLPRIVKRGGCAVLVSPYSWLSAWTPTEHWIGGKCDANGVAVRSKDALRGAMEALGFEFVAEQDVPFVIREHVRKYQWGCSHATVWRRCK